MSFACAPRPLYALRSAPSLSLPTWAG